MSGGRQASGFGALAGMGALVALCCIAGPAVLGAVAGAAIGGVLGLVAAAIVAIVVGVVLFRRRAARGAGC
jgi:hypothetical protein